MREERERTKNSALTIVDDVDVEKISLSLLLPTSQGLSKLLGDAAPTCRRENKFENYFGRQIAVDASMHIYQFLVR